MSLKPKLSLLEHSELQQLHEASLRVLQETGVAFRSEEVLAYFKTNGFKLDGEVVRFDPNQVQDALDRCPEQYRFTARNDTRSVTIGDRKPTIQPVFGCVYVQEPGKPRRLGVMADYIRYQKLVQASDVVALAGGCPVVPSDYDARPRHLHQMYQILKHTDKPIIGWAATAKQTNEMLDMIAIAGGQADMLETHHLMGTGINPLSPLSYGTETLECVLANAKRNQLLFINPAAMAGISAPIDLTGTALLQNAEILACIVLIQLVSPGLPVVYCPASVVGYMKWASFCTGSPESMLINVINFQLARELYNLPTRSLTGHTDAKIPDYQAGVETMQSLMVAIMGGAEIINEAVGTLDSYMTLSFEKYILDEETIRRMQRIHDGLGPIDIEKSLGVIREVGIGGNYLNHDTTFDTFKTLWQPTVSDWDSYDNWAAAGGHDVIRQAQIQLEQRLAETPDMLLDKALDEELQQYIRSKVD